MLDEVNPMVKAINTILIQIDPGLQKMTDVLEFLRSQSPEVYVLSFVCFLVGYWLLPVRVQRIYAAIGFSFTIILLDWVSFMLLLSSALIIYGMTKLKVRTNAMLIIGLSILIIPFIAHETARVITFGSTIYDLVFMTGMSFYTLRLVHYWWESHKQMLPAHTFLSFYSYVFFLPIFLVGPIYRFEDYMLWYRRKRWDWNNIYTGVMRISIGFFKIVVLSGYGINEVMNSWGVRVAVDNAFLKFYIPCIEYGLNIYLQFSGYSDIAIGLGMLLGYKVCENFNFPFIRANIVEFWKCWHMSLAGWARHYIFLPVITYTKSAQLAILLSMSMIGVWHGFTINALLWGLYHGVGINLYHVYKKSSIRKKLIVENLFLRRAWYMISIFITFNYVMLGNFLLY